MLEIVSPQFDTIKSTPSGWRIHSEVNGQTQPNSHNFGSKVELERVDTMYAIE
jgi:hypothetical protein